jgi:hypothetical protein
MIPGSGLRPRQFRVNQSYDNDEYEHAYDKLHIQVSTYGPNQIVRQNPDIASDFQ